MVAAASLARAQLTTSLPSLGVTSSALLLSGPSRIVHLPRQPPSHTTSERHPVHLAEGCSLLRFYYADLHPFMTLGAQPRTSDSLLESSFSQSE